MTATERKARERLRLYETHQAGRQLRDAERDRLLDEAAYADAVASSVGCNHDPTPEEIAAHCATVEKRPPFAESQAEREPGIRTVSGPPRRAARNLME